MNDAREVVKTGQVVKVRVLEVDLARKRVSLTMKLDAPPTAARERSADNSFRPPARQEQRGREPQATATPGGAMAAAFAKLQGRR